MRTDDLTPRPEAMDWATERTDTDQQLAAAKARMLARLAAGDPKLAPRLTGAGDLGDSGYPPVGGDGGDLPFTRDNPPQVTDKVLDHIIVGAPTKGGWDGGHGYGAGHGKSEFPEGWGRPEIKTAVESVLANPDEIVRRGSTLYFRGTYEGVQIEARVRGRQGPAKLWTAYPLED